MGDRANVKIVTEAGPAIWVYTHNHGHDFPKMLRGALEFCKDRWEDEPYFTRCLITELCKPAGGSATGFGVSLYPTDNEHDVMEVVFADKKVNQLSCKGYHDGEDKWPRAVLKTWSFEKFLTAKLNGGV